MKLNTWSRLSMAGWLLLAVGQASCVSNRGYQTAMDEKEAEIRGLREERAALKAQIQKNHSDLDTARGQVSEASAKPAETVDAPETAEKFPELDKMGISYGMRDGNMVISIPSSITFASGQATLSKDGQKALKEVASTLKKQYAGAKYEIEGHTDADPIKKSKFASNRELSIARAMAVLTYLVEECSIKDDQCVVAGFGQYEPLAPNDNDKDKAKNRRVEIVVHRAK
ncbi:MAG TPA: OmpA family protein [Planctomycetota bacterium]|jgi:chemotaxis protein MotB|nr:OmpA family protein [Planctomycetota bacterium]